ncbi:DUF3857 domain-containing transglutaminase family protein [Bacteroides caecigallinarum]|uniref:DUF3857 domain-containing transglutaminase family protein n=1 Tax=Bacteroides caecigallinarum TaxID=1411144 RepID=UPI001F38BC51|nr:DUF3857 and transglutaminase domain-containing protein [Bacteroides caecigallinarum]MCF2552053.1 DUF3857 and transglutaminase domain-containing protein [Bacteroides caecigallinarum]
MKIKVFLLFASLFISSAGSQANPFANYKEMLKSDKYSDYASVTLLDSTNVSVQPTGQGAFSIVKAIKVQTLKGVMTNRVLKYDYDPLTAAAKFKVVRIYHEDGTYTEVDVNKTCDYAAPARMIYWGARQIMLQLDNLKPRDVIYYEIDKKGFTYALLGAGEDDDSRFIPPMRGQFYDIVPFWVSEPTLRKVYRVGMPMEKELQFQFYQGECSSSMRYDDGRKVYTFAMDDVMPFEKEPNMVDLFDAAPKLMMSTTPDWMEKSRWFNKVNEDYGSFEAIPEAQKKVDELIKGKKSEMEKIAVLTHWVADNIRYAGITMGKGEGFTLHNLKMNYTDRCGVCKDIAGTLVAFLRMAGFDAYPAMTMAGSRVESIPADHFNHCVAVVKLSNGTLMPLDPTWVPFCRELWSSAEQQQNYLPGIPEGSDLCVTPVSAPENHYVRINADNSLKSDGTLVGKFTISAEGQSDSNIRRIFTTGFRSEWRNTMEKQLLSVSPKAVMKSVDYGRSPKDYQKAPISITFTYEIPEYAMTGDGELIFKPFVMNNLYTQVLTFLRVNTDLKDRKYGFKDSCSRLVEVKEKLSLPSGYKMLGDEKQVNIDGQAADFEGVLKQSGNKIFLDSRLSLYKRVYSADDWDDFRNSVNAYKSFGEYIVVRK